LVAMRSDAFPQLQAEPSMADLAKDTFTLDMMLEGSYRAVIEGPARFDGLGKLVKRQGRIQ